MLCLAKLVLDGGASLSRCLGPIIHVAWRYAWDTIWKERAVCFIIISIRRESKEICVLPLTWLVSLVCRGRDTHLVIMIRHLNFPFKDERIRNLVQRYGFLFIINIFIFISHSLVSWSITICQLHLCRKVRLPPHQ